LEEFRNVSVQPFSIRVGCAHKLTTHNPIHIMRTVDFWNRIHIYHLYITWTPMIHPPRTLVKGSWWACACFWTKSIKEEGDLVHIFNVLYPDTWQKGL
jgi:hypothetical protein